MELDQIEEDHIDDGFQENGAFPIMDAAENDEQLHIVEDNENNAVDDNIDVDNAEGLHAVIEDNIVSDKDDIVDPDVDEDDDGYNHKDDNRC